MTDDELRFLLMHGNPAESIKLDRLERQRARAELDAVIHSYRLNGDVTGEENALRLRFALGQFSPDAQRRLAELISQRGINSFDDARYVILACGLNRSRSLRSLVQRWVATQNQQSAELQRIGTLAKAVGIDVGLVQPTPGPKGKRVRVKKRPHA